MTSKYTNKNGVKLLATMMVLAIAVAGVVTIYSDGVDAAESSEPVTMTGAEFLEKAKNEYKLETDIVLTSLINLKSSLTLDLAGHSITRNDGTAFYINAENVKLVINDTSAAKTGSINASQYAVAMNVGTHYGGVNIDVNGGTFSGEMAFLLTGDSKTSNTFTFDDATIKSTVAGMWLSYDPIKSVSITKCTITSDDIGIYLAKADVASITSTVVDAKGTALEIKCGSDITVSKCTLTSATYDVVSTVGYSASGGSQTTVNINNAYADKDMNIAISESTITNTVPGSKPILITDDSVSIEYNNDKSIKSTTVRGTHNINVSWDGKDSDVKIIYNDNVTRSLDSTFVKTDDQVFIGLITLNDVTYVGDQVRILNPGCKVTLLNNITVELKDAFNNTNAITLGDYKLSFVAVQDADVDEETVDITKAIVNGKESSSATISGMKVGASAITFSSGSIVIEGGSEIASGSGSITITGVAKVVGDTVINGTITMADGAKLIVPEGTKLTVNDSTGIQNTGTGATVQVAGELDAKVAASATSNIDIEISSGAVVSENVAADTKKYNAEGSQTAIGNILTSDLEISTKWYLSNDLVIPEGITVNIVSGGELNLAGYNIIVLGTLNIDAGGMVASTNGTEKIYLTKGCEFSNEGTVGLGSASVTVSVNSTEINTKLNTIAGGADYKVKYNATGEVVVNSVIGIEFSIVKKTTTPSVTYTLAVGGDLTTDLESASITLDGCFISSDLTVSENIIATVTNAVTIQKDVTVTVDGELAISGTLTMTNKATVIVNGYVHGMITAQTGTYETSAGYSTGTTTVTFQAVDVAVNGIYANNEGITGIILSVGTYSFIDNTTETPVAKTAQKLYIEGSADYVTIQNNNSATAAYDNTTLDIAGNAAYVADDAVLSLKTGMIVTNVNAIVVEGAIVSADKIETAVPNYIGTSFAIKTATTPAVTTYYIKPFDAAITEIDAADKKTLTVKDNEVDISSELVLIEGQVIAIDDAVDFYISENGIVTVNSKAKITGTIDSVDPPPTHPRSRTPDTPSTPDSRSH